MNRFLRRFLMPEGAEGGGGGTALAEPPSAPDSQADANADLMSFTAPDPDSITSAITGKLSEADPEPPKTEPTKTEPPPKKEDPAPPKAKGEPPAAQLRRELESSKRDLEAARAERDDFKKRFETGDPRLVEAQNAVKAKETELAESKKQIGEYERKLLMADPAVSKQLRDLDSTFNRDSEKFFGRVPELDQGALNGLVRKYAALPFGKAEYKEARAAFETEVNEALGGFEGQEHRKLDNVLSFVERTFDFVNERNTMEREVSTNAKKLAHESYVGGYKAKKEKVASLLKAASEVPDGLEKTDPWHPKVALQKLDAILTPEQVAQFDAKIDEYVQLVMTGVAPRSDEDYAGMTQDQIRESRANEMSSYEKAQDVAVDVMRNGLRALRRIPYLIKEIQRLSAKVKEDGEGTPPDPTKGEGSSGTGPDDVSTFKAPDLSNVSF